MLSTAFLLAASMVVGQAEAVNVPDKFVKQCSYYLGKINRVEANGTTRNAIARTDRMQQDYFTWTVADDGESLVPRFRRIANGVGH